MDDSNKITRIKIPRIRVPSDVHVVRQNLDPKLRKKNDINIVSKVLRILYFKSYPAIWEGYVDGGRRRNIVLKDKNSLSFKSMLKVYLYLDQRKGNYTNSIDDLIDDYFRCVLRYYKRFGRKPNMKQLSPSTDNMLRFEDAIRDESEKYDADYWQTSPTPVVVEVKADVGKGTSKIIEI